MFILFHIAFPGVDGLVSRIPKRPTHPYGIVVPKIPADLSDDHRHRVGGKLHVQRGIKVVNGLHKADAADLKEVVGVLAAAAETANHT